MIVYAVTRNTGPSWSGPDPLYLVYLGTSIHEAKKSVGSFSKYKTDKRQIQKQFQHLYTCIPQSLNSEITHYYMADGWWYSIVMFELKENTNAS